MNVKRILVPLDGSDNAEQIGSWIQGLASPLNAELFLVTVVEPNKLQLPRSAPDRRHPIQRASGNYDEPGSADSDPYAGASSVVGGSAVTPEHGGEVHRDPAYGTQIIDRVMFEAAEYLNRAEEHILDNAIPVSRKVLMGNPAEQIIQCAQDLEVDLIALATHRGSAISRGVLGSVTDRVIRGSGIPVLAVHPKNAVKANRSSGHPETILVPLDGSKQSAEVVDTAISLAKAIDSSIVFLRVVTYPYYFVPADTYYYHTDYGQSAERQEAKGKLEQYVKRAEDNGVAARSRVVTGSAVSRILEEAGSMPSSLIVMSTRGQSKFKRWVIGSVTDKVVRSSGLPVFVIPPSSD